MWSNNVKRNIALGWFAQLRRIIVENQTTFSEAIRNLLDAKNFKTNKSEVTLVMKLLLRSWYISKEEIMEFISLEFKVFPKMIVEVLFSLEDEEVSYLVYERLILWQNFTLFFRDKKYNVKEKYAFSVPYDCKQLLLILERAKFYERVDVWVELDVIETALRRIPKKNIISQNVKKFYEKTNQEIKALYQEFFRWFEEIVDKHWAWWLLFICTAIDGDWKTVGVFQKEFQFDVPMYTFYEYLQQAKQQMDAFSQKYMRLGIFDFKRSLAHPQKW